MINLIDLSQVSACFSFSHRFGAGATKNVAGLQPLVLVNMFKTFLVLLLLFSKLKSDQISVFNTSVSNEKFNFQSVIESDIFCR